MSFLGGLAKVLTKGAYPTRDTDLLTSGYLARVKIVQYEDAGQSNRTTMSRVQAEVHPDGAEMYVWTGDLHVAHDLWHSVSKLALVPDLPARVDPADAKRLEIDWDSARSEIEAARAAHDAQRGSGLRV